MRSLYVDTLRGAFGVGRSARSKVVPVLLLAVLCVPALIIAVVTSVTGSDELPVQPIDYPISLAPAIIIFVAAQAPVAVSRDLRFRVLPLYLSRPLARSDYVLAKVAAFTTALFALVAVPVTVLYAGALLAGLPFWRETGHWLAGLLSAVVLALVLALIGLLVASVTPRRGFGVAAIVTLLLVLSVVAAILHELMTTAGAEGWAGYAGALDPVQLVHGWQVEWLGADPEAGIQPEGAAGAAVFLGLTVALVLACYALLQLRYRKVSAT